MEQSKCIKYNAISDPFVFELLTCRDAMLFSIESGFHDAVVETNCQEVVSLWQSGKDKSLGYHILREMTSLLSSLRGFNLQFMRWSANVIANVLAREALHLTPSFTIYDVILGFLIEDI